MQKILLSIKRQLIHPTWSELGAIGRSPAVRLTILVPILGYALLLNYQFLELIQTVSIQTWLPVDSLAPSNKLLTTYLGLCFLGLASAVFVWRCPPGPKSYSSEIAYAEAVCSVSDPGGDFIRAVQISRKLRDYRNLSDHESNVEWHRAAKEGLAIRSTVLFGHLASLWQVHASSTPPKSGYNSRGLVEALTTEYLKEEVTGELGPALLTHRVPLASLEYAYLNHSRAGFRALVLILYCVGFVLLAVPTAWTMFELTLHIVGSVLGFYGP